MVILLLIIFVAICFILFLIFLIKWGEAKIPQGTTVRSLERISDQLFTDTSGKFDRKTLSGEKSFEEVIPVIKATHGIPGLGAGELVHFLGNGKLYSIESEDVPEKIKIDKATLAPVLEGTVAVTSKNLLIFNGQTVKKFPHGRIEKLGWKSGYLIIKRKGVKKKREVFEVHESGSFKYIFKTLHTK